jgi:hypothetical protein
LRINLRDPLWRVRTFVSEDNLEETEPARLAEMMTLDATPPRLWSPEELGVILRHQLSVPLALDLGDPSEHAANVPNAAPMPPTTFADLLRQVDPPVAMLRRVKRFAKARKSDPNGPLPQEVATVLYYTAIAAALRCHHRITVMDDTGLRSGFEWVLRQVWVDGDTKSILEEALPRGSQHVPT